MLIPNSLFVTFLPGQLLILATSGPLGLLEEQLVSKADSSFASPIHVTKCGPARDLSKRSPSLRTEASAGKSVLYAYRVLEEYPNELRVHSVTGRNALELE